MKDASGKAQNDLRRQSPQARTVTEPGLWEFPGHQRLRLAGRFRPLVGTSETVRQDTGWHLPEPLQRTPYTRTQAVRIGCTSNDTRQ